MPDSLNLANGKRRRLVAAAEWLAAAACLACVALWVGNVRASRSLTIEGRSGSLVALRWGGGSVWVRIYHSPIPVGRPGPAGDRDGHVPAWVADGIPDLSNTQRLGYGRLYVFYGQVQTAWPSRPIPQAELKYTIDGVEHPRGPRRVFPSPTDPEYVRAMESRRATAMSVKMFGLSAPFWLLALLFSMPVVSRATRGLLRLRRSVIRQRRIAKGLCPVCSYDLRAASGVCPECGEPRGGAGDE
jgi:hypothetical protein